MTEVSPEGICTVLLAGDDPQTLENTRLLLLNAGIRPVLVLADSRATLPFLEQNNVSLIVLDMTPGMNKAELLGRICRNYPNIQVIVETASCDVEIAVNCMKSGAI